MGKVILISGVSSGFGKETASLLSEKGYVVYGTVRDSAIQSESVKLLSMDLTDNGSIKRTVSEIINREGKIDVLINNAGMVTGGPIETAAAGHIKLQMDTNFMGTVNLTREVLPHMRNAGGGIIINFSSIGGLMGLPCQGFYSASKFALEGFSEALRMEVKPFNIKIVVINPGDFHTNNTLSRRDYLAESTDTDPYHNRYRKCLEVIERDETNGQEPVVLARKLMRIIGKRNPKHRYIIGSFDQKLAVFLKHILPGKIFGTILENHYKI